MASLTFSQFLSFPSFFPRRHQQLQRPDLCRFRISSIAKARRKVKTNAELCDDIREFIAANGFPEGYVPTMKDFSQLGRSDLAYIVRRRGYKVIGEILGNTDLIGSSVEKGVSEENDVICDGEDVTIPGQYEKAKGFMVDCSTLLVENAAVEISSDSFVIDKSEDGFTSTKLPIVENHVESQEISMETSSMDDNCIDSEGSSDLSGIDIDEAEEASSNLSGIDVDVAEEASTDLSGIDVDVAEEASTDLSGIGIDVAEEASADLSGIGIDVAEEASSDLSGIGIDVAEEASSDLSGLDIDEAENGSLIAELNTEEIRSESISLYVESSQNGFHENLYKVKDVAFSSSQVFIDEPLPSTSVSVYRSQVSYEHRETSEKSSSLSLEDKVANFMRHGHLDTLEESKSDIEEGMENIELVDENVQNKGNAETNFNGSPLKPMQAVTAMTETDPLRDANLQVPFDKDPDDKTQTSKRDNNVEINHLKFMLHKKELELSRLKEQIEKEKRALSLLQAKAETEISKAQKLISEKDAELLAAEEMLSELVEVQIIYHGDGELVEVAGSFNGWHHWIKMDPQPNSSTTYTTESRKSKIWSTMLWLYPGIYEIKFVVDGEWRIDPRMESVSNGTICNNILRVHR